MASVKDKALTSFDIGSCDIISWDITGTESDSVLELLLMCSTLEKVLIKTKLIFSLYSFLLK